MWQPMCLTAPEWDEVDRMDPERKEYFTNLRSIYRRLGERAVLVILGSNKGLLAINDRLKLRPTALPRAIGRILLQRSPPFV